MGDLSSSPPETFNFAESTQMAKGRSEPGLGLEGQQRQKGKKKNRRHSALKKQTTKHVSY